MSAKSRRDQLLSQLTSSLATQPAPEQSAAVEPLPASATEEEGRIQAPESVSELHEGKKPATAKSARKRAAGKAEASAVSSPSSTGSTPVTGSGKQTALWLDDEDRGILHEMGMQLYSQGIKPSHNLVVRVALRMLPKDHRFFEKAKELIEQDGRKLRHR